MTRPPVPSSRCLFRSRRWPALPAPGQGFGLPAPLPAFQVRRQQDLPSSRQTLSMHALLTSDPGGTGAPGHSALAMLPSAPDTASAPTNSRFRGSITRPASSLSTLRSGGYPNATQDSLPGGGQPYPSGTRPAGSVRKVSKTTHLTSSLPPSPSFARRTPGPTLMTLSAGRRRRSTSGYETAHRPTRNCHWCRSRHRIGGESRRQFGWPAHVHPLSVDSKCVAGYGSC